MTTSSNGPTPEPRPGLKTGLKAGDHLYLIDGSGYIFRAYHALPPLTRKSDGLPVGAVQGFCNMLWKLLKETNAGQKPTHLAVIFDKSSKTFRNSIYPQYKAQRPEPPADLRPQFSLIKQATRAFNVSAIEQDNFEADDLIATYARIAVEAGATCRIVSSDKDLMQLVKPGVALYDTMKDREIGETEVLEKFGVTPNKVIDVQSLAGDSVDNVPGVPGIGVKTGAELINTYGSLEALLERASEIKQQKRRENLIQFADQARLSKRLVTLDERVPLEHDVGDFAVDTPKATQLIGFLKALEFTSFTRKVAGELDADMAAIEPVPVEINHWPPEGGIDGSAPEASSRRKTRTAELPQTDAGVRPNDGETSGGMAQGTDAVLPDDMEAHLRAIPVKHDEYETVTRLEDLQRWIAAADAQGFVSVDTETDSLDAMRANIVGVSMALAPGKACYIPLNHKSAGDGLFGGDRVAEQMKQDEALGAAHSIVAIACRSQDRPEPEVRHAAVEAARHLRGASR